MTDPAASTPLVIGDPVARTVTIHLREGWGDGTDGNGCRLPDGAERRSLLVMVDDVVSSVALGEQARWLTIDTRVIRDGDLPQA